MGEEQGPWQQVCSYDSHSTYTVGHKALQPVNSNMGCDDSHFMMCGSPGHTKLVVHQVVVSGVSRATPMQQVYSQSRGQVVLIEQTYRVPWLHMTTCLNSELPQSAEVWRGTKRY